MPTQNQVEIAKRLTQGMSSAPLPYGAKPKTQNSIVGGSVAANNFAFQMDREDDPSVVGLGSMGGFSYAAGDVNMHPRISK